jgi:serine/threonine protein kinase
MVNLITTFKRALRARYGGVTEVANTRHWNVASVVTADGTRCVAKLVVDHDFDDMRKASVSSCVERGIYRLLPAWWGVRYVDHFRVPDAGFVIVTTDFPNRSWSTYVPSEADDAAVVRQLKKQLRWLQSIGVAHGDLELKNILLSSGPRVRVAIIDFEKSTRRASVKKLRIDVSFLADNLAMSPNTASMSGAIRGMKVCG